MAKSNRQRKRDRAVRQAAAARRQRASLTRQIVETAYRMAGERLERIYDPATPVDELAGLLLDHYDGAPVTPGLTQILVRDGASAERLAAVADAIRAAEVAYAAETASAAETANAAETADSSATAEGPGGVEVLDGAHAADGGAEAADSADTAVGVEGPDGAEAADGGAETADSGDTAVGVAGPDGAEAADGGVAVTDAPQTPQTTDSPGGDKPSLTYLTFAACAAHAGGDVAGARRFMDAALASADPDMRLRLTAHLEVCGRAADAVELLEARLRESPAGGYAEERYAVTIEHIALRSAELPAGQCGCGSGASWDDCCAPRERAALDRFADGSGLSALQDAVASYLPTSAYAEAVPAYVTKWMAMADTGRWDENQTLRALITGLSWTLARASGADAMAGPAHDDEVMSGGDGDGAAGSDSSDGDNLLTAFAEDPATPPALATRARGWLDHVHYGLWQVSSPAPPPGRWYTDIVTGAVRYIAGGPEHTCRLPRWSVVLGAVVPVDGIWRQTGPALRLSPVEADAAAETMHTAVAAIVRRLAGKSMKQAGMNQPTPFGRAQPHGVLVHHRNQEHPELTRLTSIVVASLLPRIAAEVHDWRTAFQATPGGGAEPAEGAEKQWLDERIPALRGRTPRQAGQSKEWVLLEALLRQLEYDADRRARDGKAGPDTAWLRAELGLVAEEFD